MGSASHCFRNKFWMPTFLIYKRQACRQGGPQRYLGEKKHRKAKIDLSLGCLCWERCSKRYRITQTLGDPRVRRAVSTEQQACTHFAFITLGAHAC